MISENQEELVPMINATQFDDESEGNIQANIVSSKP